MERYVTIAILAVLFSTEVSAEDWVNNFVSGTLTPQSTISSGPISLRSAERRYASAGSFSARYPVSGAEYPITVNPPKIKMGCGGIDVWTGGLSYIEDPAYYVTKLQNSLRSAAFIAFDMALKNMCQQCSAAMEAAEKMAAQINSINLDECAIANKSVVYTKNWLSPEAQGSEVGKAAQEREIEATSGGSKNPTEAHSKFASANGAATSTASMNTALDACPTKFKDIFKNGSMVGNIATALGLQNQQEVLRGYIGDVRIGFDASSNMFTADTMEPCPRNLSLDLDAFVWGEAQKRQMSNDQCVTDSTSTLVAESQKHLTNLVSSYKISSSPKNLPAENFIALVPLQVERNLRSAILLGAENEAIQLMAEPVAVMYAGRAMQNLLDRADEVIKYGIEVASTPGVNGAADPNDCRRELVEPAIEYLRSLRPRMWEMRKTSKQQMAQKLQEISISLQVAKAEQDQYQRASQQALKRVSE